MPTLQEIPLVRLTVCFIVGIISTVYFRIPSSTLLYALLLSTMLTAGVIYFLSFYTLKKYSFLLVALTFIGFGHSYFNNHEQNEKLAILESFQNYFIVGYLSDVKHNEQYHHGYLNTLQIGTSNDSMADGSLKIRVTLDDSIKEYQDNDILFLQGMVQDLYPNKNPNTFDYKGYLERQHVYQRMFLKGAEINVIGKRNNWIAYPSILNSKARTILEKHIDNPENASIAIAMITGNKNDIPDELYETYSRVGAIHLLAVSGLHVGIVAGILFLFLGIKPNTGKIPSIKLIILLMGIWFFVFFTGAKPAVLRAGIMFSLLLYGKSQKALTNNYNLLFGSAFITLLYDPHLLFDLGFQFSYIAVLSILYFYKPINSLIYFKQRIINYLWGLVSVALAANVLVFPISVYYFHNLSIAFIFTGLLAVPFAFLIIALGLAILILDPIASLLNAVIGPALDLILSIMNYILRVIESIPNLSLENVWIKGHNLILIYLSIYFLASVIASKKLKSILYLQLSMILTVLTFVYSTYNVNNQKQIIVYDLYGKVAIDFYDGNQCYSFIDEKVTETDIQYNIEPNRLSHGIQEVIELDIKTSMDSSKIHHRNNLISFNNQIIYIKNESDSLIFIPKEIDILISNSPFKNKDLEIPKTTQVVFTNHKSVNRQPETHQQNDIYSIARSGPFKNILN